MDVDEAGGWIYFSGTERSHIGNDVYRIKTDGTGLSRLSKADGTHAAEFSPAFAYYLDKWSDVTTPPQTRLHKSDGTEVRVIDENKVSALADYKLSKPELLQVKTRDGFVMEAMMIKPPDFDPLEALSCVSVHLRRSAHAAGAQSVGRFAVHVSPAARTERDHRLDLRQPDGERQGQRISLAPVQELWRDRAARHRGRRELARSSKPYVDRVAQSESTDGATADS